jgi:hypothetical protein
LEEIAKKKELGVRIQEPGCKTLYWIIDVDGFN